MTASERRSPKNPTDRAAFSMRLTIALSLLLALPSPLYGQACVGDCDADFVVRLDELVLGVRIALGSAPVRKCAALDADASSSVDVDELLRAVDYALSACPNTVRVHGACRIPGAGGLEPCPAGTRVTLGRCVERRRCLHESGSRRLLFIGRTELGGSFTAAVDRDEIGPGALVLEAEVAPGAQTTYRGLSFAVPGAGETRLEIPIDPVSEAGVMLLEENGLEYFDDTGAQEVVDAVRGATAGVDFRGLDAAGALTLALGTAREDAAVQETIAARATPTSTPTATRTPTPTPTHAPGVCALPPRPTPPEVQGATFRLSSTAGAPGETACLGGLLQTAGLPIVGLQLDIEIIPDAPIAAVETSLGYSPACAPDPAGGVSPGFTFEPFDCTPGKDCTAVHVLLIGGLTDRLPDGKNYFTCELAIPPLASAGTYPIGCSNSLASDGAGGAIELGCMAGTVAVVAAKDD